MSQPNPQKLNTVWEDSSDEDENDDKIKEAEKLIKQKKDEVNQSQVIAAKNSLFERRAAVTTPQQKSQISSNPRKSDNRRASSINEDQVKSAVSKYFTEDTLGKLSEISDEDEDFAQTKHRSTNLAAKKVEKKKVNSNAHKAQTDTKAVIQKRNILDVIELSELQNFENQDKVVLQMADVFGEHDQFKEYKHNILKLDQMYSLSAHLANQKHKYFSKINCIATYGRYIFVGCESGMVRVINLDSDPAEELKPLHDKQLIRNQVLTIDVSSNMQFLVCGHQNGNIALWDLRKFKLEKIISDVHTSEIRAARIIKFDEENFIRLVSVEANGPCRQIELKKSIIGSKNHEFTKIYDRVQTPINIVCNFLKEKNKTTWYSETNLVAITSVSFVFVASLHSFDQCAEILKMKRPQICQKGTVPYVDFGFGYLSSLPDQQKLLLAIAWDCTIQLVYFDENNHNSATIDGYFLSDDEIQSCFFIADSTLMITTQSQQTQVLNTKLFEQGDYKVNENPDDLEIILKKKLQSIKEVSKGALFGIEPSDQFQLQTLATQQIQIKEGVILNANPALAKFKRQIYMLSAQDTNIFRFSTRSYQEYLEHIKVVDECSWSQRLKAAMSIYQGTLSGFFNIPNDTKLRQSDMKNFMIQHLMENIQEAFSEIQFFEIAFDNGSLKGDLEKCKMFVLETIIDYCLGIEQRDLLFNEIYNNYVFSTQFETTFAQSLGKFIISGRFANYNVPSNFIKSMVQEYQQRQDFVSIEKIVFQINLPTYSYIDELQEICLTQKLTNASIFILISRCNPNDKELGIYMILNKFHSKINELEEQERQKSQDSSSQFILRPKKSDLLFSDKLIRDVKAKMTTTTLYLRYKLFWFIKLLSNGRSINRDQLFVDEDLKEVLKDLIQFIIQQKVMQNFLEFDPETFFESIIGMFSSKSLTLISQVILADPKLQQRKLFQEIETRAEQIQKENRQNDALDQFYKFILQLHIQQVNEAKLLDRKESQPLKIKIDYQILLRAILRVINALHEYVTNNTPEKFKGMDMIVYGFLKCETLKDDDLDLLIKTAGEIKDQLAINIKVVLFEVKKDYVQALKSLLQSTRYKFRVFEWLRTTFKTLKTTGTDTDLNAFKQATKQSMRELLQLEIQINTSQDDDQIINFEEKQKIRAMQAEVGLLPQSSDLYCQMCLFIIKTQFDDLEYIKRLVTQDIYDLSTVQLHFLKTFITVRDKQIAQIIDNSFENPEYQEQSKIYCQLIQILTTRLCEHEPENVEKWVEREYFPPRECMEICRSKGMIAAEAFLINKVGDGMQALRLYTQVMNKIAINRMIDQLLLIRKEDWDFGRVYHSKDLGRFDYILDKAYKIAGKVEDQGFRFVYGEEGWFLILQFLQNLFQESAKRIGETQARFQDNQRALRVIQDFYSKRISYVLKRDDISLSLRTVADRLSLQYDQIKNLCLESLWKLKGDKQRDQSCQNVLRNDLFKQFWQLDDFVVSIFKFNSIFKASGYTTYSFKFSRSKEYLTLDLCQKCKKPLLEGSHIEPYESFTCGHLYHPNCLEGKERCPKCEQKDLLCKFASIQIITLELQDDLENQDTNAQKEQFNKGNFERDTKQRFQDQRLKLTLRHLDALNGSLLDECLQTSDFK